MFIDSQRKASAQSDQRSYQNIGFQQPMGQQEVNYYQPQAKELMTITIEIGDGQQANILIRENDDPFELAQRFAVEHGINEQLTELLAEQIRMNIEQVIQEEMENSRLIQQQQINRDMPRQQSWGQTFDAPKNQNVMNIYQNPFYQPGNNHNSKSNKSFIDDKGGVSLTNQSFHTERSNFNNQSQLSGIPGSTQYTSWQQQIYNKFNTLDQGRKEIYPTINENSKKMIEQKRSGSASKAHGTVHSRLHQQAVTKQKYQKQAMDNSFNLGGSSRINRSSFGNLGGGKQSNHSTPTRKRSQQRASSLQNRQQQYNSGHISTVDNSNQVSHRRPSQVVNYGERLYQKGLKRKEELERHIRDAKNEQERFNQEQFSFQPQINESSRYMMRPRNERPEDSLMNYGKQVKEKIDQMRSEVMHQEIEQCKFRPSISKKSERIMNEKMYGNGYEQQRATNKPPVNKFAGLYEDAKRRKERQDQIYSACMEAECTFQPDTSETRYYHSQNRDPNNTSTVYQRLSNHGSKERQIDKSQLHQELFDPETGQEYFKPKVGRAPKNQYRPLPGEGVGHMLYEHSKNIKEKQEFKQRIAEDEKKIKATTVFTQEQTNRIIEKAKIQKFAEIFRQLDSDGDSIISANRIDISCLPADVLEVLTPLFVEMEELGQTLDEEEFIDAVGRLYDAITLPEKNILLQQKQKWDKSKSKHADEKTFKPQLNANSLRIAAKKRPNANVADILLQKKEEYQQKIYEKQQEKENSELVGCTFHPNILQSPATEINSSRSRSYNRQAMMMLNNSNHSNSGFDINNLAHNIANEVLRKQQQQQQQQQNTMTGHGQQHFMSDTLRNQLILRQDAAQFGITSGGGSFTGSSSKTAHVNANGGIRQQLMMMN